LLYAKNVSFFNLFEPITCMWYASVLPRKAMLARSLEP